MMHVHGQDGDPSYGKSRAKRPLRKRAQAVLRRLGIQVGPSKRQSDSPDLWEKRYQAKGDSSDFFWLQEEGSKELDELVAGGLVPSGAALDLGCGPGVNTEYLAQHFRPTFALDIAPSVGNVARKLWREKGVEAHFLAAAAPSLPFASDSFSLVFDRGCMHCLPPEQWEAHLLEVARVLRPEGIAQMIEGRGLTLRQLANRVPPTLEVVQMEKVNQQIRSGKRQMTNAVLRKRTT